MSEVTHQQKKDYVSRYELIMKGLEETIQGQEFSSKLSQVILEDIRNGSFKKMLNDAIDKFLTYEEIEFIYDTENTPEGKRLLEINERLGKHMEQELNTWRSNMERKMIGGSLEQIIQKLLQAGMPPELAERMRTDTNIIVSEIKPGDDPAQKLKELRESGKLTLTPEELKTKISIDKIEIAGPDGKLEEVCLDPKCEGHKPKNKKPGVDIFGM